MKVGAEPKKVAVLIGLGAVAAYLVSRNLFPGSVTPPAPDQGRTALARETRPADAVVLRRPEPEPARVPRAELEEFRPSLRAPRGGERDLSAVDPRLRVDLLARLQQVELQGGHRSLFDFGAAPLPKAPEPKIIPKEPIAALPTPPNPNPQDEVRTPAPPPIPLRFYGFTLQGRQGPRRAFFLDGEEIYVASEGEVLKKRYKVVRIGLTSAVVEDLESKHQQTLPLMAEAG
ncbi:MAG: hypothetical protein RMK57_11600 [Bryobacterales bacterium]|nr:hypothetical protein [Bryobacteraceae bacterium]MDW8355164.1 hypothetical protein [Bryobacterales bacterium]